MKIVILQSRVAVNMRMNQDLGRFMNGTEDSDRC